MKRHTPNGKRLNVNIAVGRASSRAASPTPAHLFRWSSPSVPPTAAATGSGSVGRRTPSVGAKSDISVRRSRALATNNARRENIPGEHVEAEVQVLAHPCITPGAFVPQLNVVLSVVSVSGEELVQIPDAKLEWSCAEVVIRLPPLFPWQHYTLVVGEEAFDDSRCLGDMFGPRLSSADHVQMLAMISESEYAQVDKDTALHIAARKLNLDEVQKLLEDGASVTCLRGGKTALLESIEANLSNRSGHKGPADVRNQKVVMLTLLLAKSDPSAIGRNGKTAFEMLLPLATQDVNFLRACLNAGVSATACVTSQCQNQANARSLAQQRQPLLYSIAKAGRIDVARELLAARAEVDARASCLEHDERGMSHNMETSLHAACAAGDTAMVACLIDHGASVNALRKRAEQQHNDLTKSGRSRGNTSHIVQHAEADCLTPIIESALHVALEQKHLSLVTMLVSARADVGLRQLQGNIPKTVEELCDRDAELLTILGL